MRVLGRDCGCDARRDIIFTRGGAGLPEAAVLATIVVTLAVAWKLGHRSPAA